jgi:hypothetical protein
MLCINQELEKFSILSSWKINPCESCRVGTQGLAPRHYFFTLSVLPTENHIDSKKNQWCKFNGREHVPVVGTGKDVTILDL